MNTLLVHPAAPSAQQRRAADPNASVWVSASAGAGKTKVLTDRVLSLLLDGTPPENLLCLTFTRAAAAEMAGRVADRLGEWTMAEDADLSAALEELRGSKPDKAMLDHARRLFARVLDAPGGLQIETIHAFCQSLLRRFPIEAQLAPHFALMEERDAAELLTDARADVLNRARQGSATELVAALTELTRYVHEAEFAELVASISSARGRFRRLITRHGSTHGLIRAVREVLGLALGETAETIVAAAADDDAFDVMGLRLAVEALRAGSSTDAARAEVIAGWLAADDRESTFDTYIGAYLTKEGKTRKTLITKKAAEASPGVDQILVDEAARLAHILVRRRAAVTADATAALVTVANALLDAYRTHKEARALLDYDDLILEARNLLSRPGVAPWVLFKLDGGLDHVLIDEAQDTSPDQWRVVDALADEFFAGTGARKIDRTLFAVGDVKQSIYSFQGADPVAFTDMRAQLSRKVPASGGAWQEVDLTISFRSTRAVLEAVDTVFAAADAADGVALDGHAISHQAWRANDGGLVELWPPVEPRPADEEPAWKPPIERIAGDSPQARLARLVAERIQRMVDDHEMLDSKNRPIQPGDIMVLVRRRTSFVDELVRALKERRIGVAGADRLILTEHIAVMDLIALGRFLLLPEDDLTLATVLKSPLIGLSEDDLFALAHGRPGTLWEALGKKAADRSEFEEARAFLADLLAVADFMPPFELYADILGARGGRRRIVARLGPDAEDPLGEFLNLAISYERAHVPSLEGFLQWLEAGAVEIKRDLEQATRNAVRVMTVHGAKGLQAPIVFLPDTMQVPRGRSSLLWQRDGDGDSLVLWPPRRAYFEEIAEELDADAKRDRDREYRRLLYVAMTRAEDRLYVCGWKTKVSPPEGCWYNLIQTGLDLIADEAIDAGLDQWGDIPGGTVLRLVSPQAGEPEPPYAQEENVFGGLPEWAFRPPPPEALPPSPLVPSRPEGEEPPVRSPLGADDGVRFRRGRLIHALLQTLPDLDAGERPAAAAAFLARSAPDLEDAVRAQIVEETLSVIEGPDFAPLFAPGSRAEVPIVGRVGDQVMSGQIDRLLVTDTEVTIVDYKTNRPPPAEPDHVPAIYLRQMAIYRTAVGEIYPGKSVRCLLLWTDGPSIMTVPEALTDRYVP